MKILKQSKKGINFKALLITHSVISVIFVVYAVIVLSLILTVLPFPQRVAPWFMDQQMKSYGEATSLNLEASLIIMDGALYVAMLIMSGIMIYYFFYYNPRHNYNLDFTPSPWITAGTIVFSIFFLLLPPIFVWFFYIPYDRWIKDRTHSTSTTAIKSRRNIWISVSTVATLGVATIVPAVAFSYLDNGIGNKVPDRYNDLNEMYTLSENHPNTMVLYFDRCMGLFFNELLALDYYMFHKSGTSFIDEFPQFTSYVNSLSQDMVTNLSNPNINGSWFMSPEFKNMNLIDPIFKTQNLHTDMEKWYLNSYRSSFGMFTKHGYSNISLLNASYYEPKQKYDVNANDFLLQQELQKMWDNHTFYPLDNKGGVEQNVKFKLMDVTPAIKSLGQKPMGKEKDDSLILQDFCSSSNDYSKTNDKLIKDSEYGNNTPLKIDGVIPKTNLKVKDRPGSSYLFLQFLTTHELYKWVENKNCIDPITNPYGINYKNVDDGHFVAKGRNPDEFIVSIWYTIQKLKRIFHYMENLPCHDPSRPWVKNQYENTNIYIISDHGAPIAGKQKQLKRLQKYLLDIGLMNKKQYDYISNVYLHYKEMSFGFWNSTIARKPALYSNPNWNPDNNTPEKFFNQTDLVTDSDLQPMIEADIAKQNFDANNHYTSAMTKDENYHFDETKSFYFDKKTNSVYKFTSSDPEIQSLLNLDCNNQFILDPLHSNKIKLGERVIPMYYGEWKFIPHNIKYKLWYKYYFVNRYPGGIFNVKNYSKSSIKGLN